MLPDRAADGSHAYAACPGAASAGMVHAAATPGRPVLFQPAEDLPAREQGTGNRGQQTATPPASVARTLRQILERTTTYQAWIFADAAAGPAGRVREPAGGHFGTRSHSLRRWTAACEQAAAIATIPAILNDTPNFLTACDTNRTAGRAHRRGREPRLYRNRTRVVRGLRGFVLRARRVWRVFCGGRVRVGMLENLSIVN